uniref:Uncharacterized protein n=1 Tax=viral metagenome TaxID=1070528 RepID=A0A6C0JSJ8_9ZZZZ
MERGEVAILVALGIAIAVIIVVAVVTSNTSQTVYVEPAPRLGRPPNRRVNQRSIVRPRQSRIEIEEVSDSSETSCDRVGGGCRRTCCDPMPTYGGSSDVSPIGPPRYDPEISNFMGGGVVGGTLAWLVNPVTVQVGSDTVNVERSSYMTYNATTFYLLTLSGKVLESPDGLVWSVSPMNDYLPSRIIHISGTDDSLWMQSVDAGTLVTELGVVTERVEAPNLRFYSRFNNTLYTTLPIGTTSSFKWATYDNGGTLYTLDPDSSGRTIDHINGTNYVFR